MLKLRPPQKTWVGNIYRAWEKNRSVLGVFPTGGGKTVCFSHIVHNHVGATAVLAHRKEIIGQISSSLAALEVPHRVIAPVNVVSRIRRRHLKTFGRSWVDPWARAGVVSVQTVTSRGSSKNKELQNWLKQVSLAVFDEGHHYIQSGFWSKVVENLYRAKLLFVTATPERLDGKGLGSHADGFADTMVLGPTLRDQIEDGYLTPYRYLAPATDINTDNLPVTASGEFNRQALRARVVESHLVGDVVTHYQKHAAGKQAIVFADSVATAEEIENAFTTAGVRAAAVSGGTDSGERDSAVDSFENHKLQVLVNVDLFDEGFDVPGAEVCIMARPTDSLAKFMQMVGRVLRPIYANGYDLTTIDGRKAAIHNSNKPSGIVLDMVRNWERGHGMPCWPRSWTLDARIKGTREQSNTLELRACLSCTQPYLRYLDRCPWCGVAHEPQERSSPMQVDGDLMALDVDALAQVFERIRKADMSREEYTRDQIARGIPPIGRCADMRRHEAARHRRKVFHELASWWFGLQPADRSLSEKQRRFYLRFEVDIGTAYTLNATDTDALIDRLEESFRHDLH